MKYRGAIFDMDGLLFDTERVFQETWQELAQEYRVVLEESFTRTICGTSGEQMYRILERYYHVKDGKAVRDACMERMRQKLSVEVPVKKGAVEILRYFKEKGIRIAVASSSAREQILSNLRLTGTEQYFDQVVSGKDVPNGKPAPDIFLLASEKIGCDPRECCVFEDSVNGIRAGYAAGCDAIMIPDLVEPTEEIRTMCHGVYQDLTEAIRGIEEEK